MAPRVITPRAVPLFIIPMFIPHLGCPHQCVFCNQHAITGSAAQFPSAERIRNEVHRLLSYGKRDVTTTQISFFGGNFLGLDPAAILSLLHTVLPFTEEKSVAGIRFSTRPDTVNGETLALLEGFPVQTVELGVQSMNDHVLTASHRGHRSSDTIQAVALLKKAGYQVGLQMMVGLPGDDDQGAMESAHRIAALSPDFVRIYPTVVLKGSLLASWYRAGRYTPIQLARCVTLVKRIYLYFKRLGIPVARMGLQAADGLTPDKDLLAGPFHPAFGHMVLCEIVLDAVMAAIRQMAHPPDTLTITTHPSMVSRVQGLKKKNIEALKRTFCLKAVNLVQDQTLSKNQLQVEDKSVSLP